MRALGARRVIGVLGGMGPAATFDFCAKITAATVAVCDQEHLPLIVYSIPQIPDRGTAILNEGPSPAPMLVDIARRLEAAGAALIVMPCNTAHHWFDAVRSAVAVPLLHIAEPVLREIERLAAGAPVVVGLLATRATLRTQIHAKRARQAAPGLNAQWIAPYEAAQTELVDAGIAAVKAGHLIIGQRLLEQAAKHLIERGAQVLVLACTEVPLVVRNSGVPTLDATQLLAKATVAWSVADWNNLDEVRRGGSSGRIRQRGILTD
jgi:aspartate racemase